MANNPLTFIDADGQQNEPVDGPHPAHRDLPGEADQAIDAAQADQRFQALPPELQRAVRMGLARGQGNLEELLTAATFNPTVSSGFRVLGPEREGFLAVLRRAMIVHREFREEVLEQAARDGPVIMRVFRNSPRVVVDASEGADGTGPWGRHVVDMADVEAFPSLGDAALPYPTASTAEQNVVHFVIEAIREREITGASRFERAHARATEFENRFRLAIGQQGELQNVAGTSRLIFSYRGAPDEIVRVLGATTIVDIVPVVEAPPPP
jgi:hypothetical protein